MPSAEEIFFELYEGLPRQGPGNLACTRRAYELCAELPAAPKTVDLGCGTGAQTFDLLTLGAGSIVAIDQHAPSIERLRASVVERGLQDQIMARVGDMAEPGLEPGSFDLVWSEGALYSVGLETSLPVCRSLLGPGGYLAFSDAVWRTEDAPAHVRESFADYPGMGRVDDVLKRLEESALSVVGHFPVPDEAWWDDFYTPMEQRIEALRAKYASHEAALRVLEAQAEEPRMYQEHSAHFGYEFFICRRR